NAMRTDESFCPLTHYLSLSRRRPYAVSARHPLSPPCDFRGRQGSWQPPRPMALLHLPEPSAGTKVADPQDVLTAALLDFWFRS
uniref:Uncharacterized protein n=2 Tax=Aegilops tauschii subsp. strangulata TaxID=200361 RepID=A0A453GQ73_AEGTS